jgi:toxin ParE1/3/4
MRVFWSPEAIDDLNAVRVFISNDSPRAARAMALRVVEAVEALPDHPNIGRPGRVPGTRELVVSGTPFIVPYRIQGNALQVLRIYHAARRWPDRL